MRWVKEGKNVWRRKIGIYYMIVQRRHKGKSRPVHQYYWRTSRNKVLLFVAFKGLEYELSRNLAMRAAKGAVLEAKIYDSMRIEG
jgi:hypothetical protein